MTIINDRPIRRGDLPGARHMLARAFDDDPPSRWLFPHRRRRAVALRAVMGSAVVDSRPFGHVRVAIDAGAVIGLASWLPPGAYPPGSARLARQSLAMIPVGGLFPASIRKGSALLARMQQVHPKEEHWYLGLLAVDPSLQGRGVGSTLIAAGLAAADADGRPAYLETAKERNLAFYRRHGFDVIDELQVRGGPPMWTMLRPAPPG